MDKSITKDFEILVRMSFHEILDRIRSRNSSVGRALD
jgi:hypothetical protein